MKNWVTSFASPSIGQSSSNALAPSLETQPPAPNGCKRIVTQFFFFEPCTACPPPSRAQTVRALKTAVRFAERVRVAPSPEARAR